MSHSYKYNMEMLCAIENHDIEMINKLLTDINFMNGKCYIDFIIKAIETCNLQIIQPFLHFLSYVSLSNEYKRIIEHIINTHNEEVIKLIFDTLSKNNNFLFTMVQIYHIFSDYAID